ncbi:MAG: xanthine dehydrogenase family protein subunit M [Deltaproteobacteria bacterium]|nr:xanthine dehydrogenase family protein subunit M [Deltaproteobacteria bacterium]
MQDFTYHAPAELSEALSLHRADPEHTRFLAGGTDLYLSLEHGDKAVRHVVDLKGISGLSGIRKDPDGSFHIGALTLMVALERHSELNALYPVLCEAAHMVGGPALRNRATVGGNVCNASPAADTGSALLALEAQAVVVSNSGERRIPIRQLWRGPRQNTLAPGEVLATLVLPPQPAGTGSAFARVTRSVMDISVVNASAVVRLDDAGRIAYLSLSVGAVAPTPLAVPEASKMMLGKTPNEVSLTALSTLVESLARPITDNRGNMDYRRDMAGVLAARVVRIAAERAIPLRGRGDR